MTLNGWVDSHCHLTDARMLSKLTQVLERARQHNVKYFLLGGVSPQEWLTQEKICAEFPDQIWPCFGVHPYFVAENTPEKIENALSLLAQKAPQALALGEMGLDFRSHLIDGGKEKQITAFVWQLELAKKLQKPAVLHIVRAHEEAFQVLKKVRPLLGVVHAFNGSWRIAETYLQNGLYLSIGGAVLKQNNVRLRESATKIPLERLLIESDAPDQAPPHFKPGTNEPWTITLVASQIAELRGIEPEEVLQQTQQNFIRLFMTVV